MAHLYCILRIIFDLSHAQIFGTKYCTPQVESDVYIDGNKLGVINSYGHEVQGLLWSREVLSDSKHDHRIITWRWINWDYYDALSVRNASSIIVGVVGGILFRPPHITGNLRMAWHGSAKKRCCDIHGSALEVRLLSG